MRISATLWRGGRGREALLSGDANGGVITAGMVAGLIDDIPSCAQLLKRMMVECREELARAQARLPML